MSLDHIRELNAEISKRIAEAHDKGASNMITTIIELADANGGTITIEQLRTFESYVARRLAEENQPKHVIHIDQTKNDVMKRWMPRCDCGWQAFMPFYSKSNAELHGHSHLKSVS
jgi:hypothetical protein